MRILAAGGGSGGHVTPVVAVLHELKRRERDAEVRFWCDRSFGNAARSLLDRSGLDIRMDTVVSGKFRRYYHLSKIQHFTTRAVFWPNVRDGVLIVCGIMQSVAKLIIWRPDVVFTKGGYVCLPIGLAAHWLRIPLVIHDSDAHPGLTNRILARWATTIATGAPLEHYPYPTSRTVYVGIPIAEEFRPYTPDQVAAARAVLGVDAVRPLVVVTGGGLGAVRLNNAVMAIAPELLATMTIVLISGVHQYAELQPRAARLGDHFVLKAFVDSGMADVMGAADVVVARAGATTILELAALQKPTILVPNAHLTGGHQLKNAAVYESAGAVLSVRDDAIANDPAALASAIRQLVEHPAAARDMAATFATFAKPSAARDMAQLIIDAAT